MRSVIVTGASTGIGRTCAVSLARRGFRVYAGVRTEEAGDAISKEAASLTPVLLDVTDSAAIAALVERRSAECPEGVAGVVNNAGVSIGGPLEFLPMSEFKRQFEINVIGLVSMTQALLPLIRQGKGRIVNISSTSGFFTTPFLGAYCASKHAVESISDALRMELAPSGVRVAIVQPGAIATPIWDKSLGEADAFIESAPPELEHYYGAGIASLKKVAQDVARHASPPEVVADAVHHALTAKRPKTRYLVGKNAFVERCISRLPTRLQDWVVGKIMPM